MAKKRGVDELFSSTEPKETKSGWGVVKIPAEGRTLPVGVGLKESEVAMLDDIASELGVARNALLRWAVRYFLLQYKRGAIDMTQYVHKETKSKIDMP